MCGSQTDDPSSHDVVSWDGAAVITTLRLLLRTFRQDDLPHYAALNADPAVYRHLSGEPLSARHSDEIAEWAQECYARERLGLLAVERLEDSRFIGMCGLHHQESFPDDIEVGWRFASQHWGHGYATEAARAWLGYGFDELDATRIISITDAANVRSLAVMERIGMHFEQETEIVDDGLRFQAVVYVITAEQRRLPR